MTKLIVSKRTPKQANIIALGSKQNRDPRQPFHNTTLFFFLTTDTNMFAVQCSSSTAPPFSAPFVGVPPPNAALSLLGGGSEVPPNALVGGSTSGTAAAAGAEAPVVPMGPPPPPLPFGRLHPSILERVFCALFPQEAAQGGGAWGLGPRQQQQQQQRPSQEGSGTAACDVLDDAWTSALAGCFLGVELFAAPIAKKGGGVSAAPLSSSTSKDLPVSSSLANSAPTVGDAAAVALAITQAQLLVVRLEGYAAVSHAVDLHLGGLREVIVEHVHYPEASTGAGGANGSGEGDGYGTSSSLSSSSSPMRVLHTVCVRYLKGSHLSQQQQQQQNARLRQSGSPMRRGTSSALSGLVGANGGLPLSSIVLHFPSSEEFSGFMFALGSLMATLYPSHGMAIVWGEGGVPSFGGRVHHGIAGPSGTAAEAARAGKKANEGAGAKKEERSVGANEDDNDVGSAAMAAAAASEDAEVAHQLAFLAGVPPLPGTLALPVASGTATAATASSTTAVATRSRSPQRASSPSSSSAAMAVGERLSLCRPADVYAPKVLWSSVDRSTARLEGIGGFYCHSNNNRVGGGGGDDHPLQQQQQNAAALLAVSGAGVGGGRGAMVGPALAAAAAVTDDDLRRARQSVDGAEAAVLLRYEALTRDVRGAISHLRRASLRCAKLRARAAARLYNAERRRLSEDILPMERELAATAKTLAQRRSELAGSQSDAFHELAQWSGLEQTCRRIEAQRLQSVKDAQQRNLDAVAERRALLEARNEELWALKEEVDGYATEEGSGPYAALLADRNRLVASLEADTADLRSDKAAFSEAQRSTAKAEKDLSATLTALRRTIREAEAAAAVAEAKGEQCLSVAASVAKDGLHQQSLIEKELERRLAAAEGGADEACGTLAELTEGKVELEALLAQGKATQQRLLDASRRGCSVVSALSDTNEEDYAAGGGGGGINGYGSGFTRDSRRLFDLAATDATSGARGAYSLNRGVGHADPFSVSGQSDSPAELVRGNRNRWDLSFIPRRGNGAPNGASAAASSASLATAAGRRAAAERAKAANNSSSSQHPHPQHLLNNNSASNASLATSRRSVIAGMNSSHPTSPTANGHSHHPHRDGAGGAASFSSVPSTPMGSLSGAHSPSQRRAASGAMFLVERARADEAAALRVRSEEEAQRCVEARLQAIRDQLQRSARRAY